MFMELSWILLGVFSLVTLIQLIYYVVFFRRLAFYKEPSYEHSREQAVSVVICARDEADNLERNLPGVLVQDYQTTHEVVLVDDNSQDDTRYLLEGLHRQFRQLHIVELKQEAILIPGKKFPLSMGIKSARHEIVLLTDADCIPASDQWIRKMQEPFRDGVEIVLGYGAYHKRSGFFNKLIRFETFHSALQYLSYALAGIPYMGVGRNLAYRRELFFRHKGFSSHNHIPGGDDDLFINMAANSQNTRVVVHPDAHTLSKPQRNFATWYRQKNRHYSTSKHYKGKHKFLLGLYSLTQFVFYPLLAFLLVYGDWKTALSIFGARLLLQAILYYRVMQKLNEKDLFPLFLLFDILQPFYLLLFAPAVIRQHKTSWK
jgi:cellulose synthase/poly-beta-1,6-N-acetylglucosamine synthase-like glycosyltransferase